MQIYIESLVCLDYLHLLVSKGKGLTLQKHESGRQPFPENGADTPRLIGTEAKPYQRTHQIMSLLSTTTTSDDYGIRATALQHEKT